MPNYIQSALMSKLFSSFPAYIKFVQEEEEKAEEETEKEDEVDEEDDTGDVNNDEKEGENAEEGNESDPGLGLFDNQ